MEINNEQEEWQEEVIDLHKVRKIGENGRTLTPVVEKKVKVVAKMDKEAIIK